MVNMKKLIMLMMFLVLHCGNVNIQYIAEDWKECHCVVYQNGKQVDEYRMKKNEEKWSRYSCATGTINTLYYRCRKTE